LVLTGQYPGRMEAVVEIEDEHTQGSFPDAARDADDHAQDFQA
jgi:hypothetical protein